MGESIGPQWAGKAAASGLALGHVFAWIRILHVTGLNLKAAMTLSGHIFEKVTILISEIVNEMVRRHSKE